MKTAIGGDRLGSGNKQDVHLKNFGRSSHDLSYKWRSTIASGTLTPFLTEIGLPGDSWDINLSCEILTLPTVGPLFGSYKVQLDVFSCPIRLYQRELHMNKLGIGNNMSNIKMPQIRLRHTNYEEHDGEDNAQIDPSSIFSHLGIRGLGKIENGNERYRDFFGVPFLGYWDIYKQYYANKQEEEGVVIHAGTGGATAWNMITATYRPTGGASTTNLLGVTNSIELTSTSQIWIRIGGGLGTPDFEEIIFYTPDAGGNNYNLRNEFQNETIGTPDENGEIVVWYSDYIGDRAGTGNWSIEDEAIQGIIAPDGKPRLQRFPLSNIDDMREKLLTEGVNGSSFIIDGNIAMAPYSLPFASAFVEGKTIYAKQFTQEGLACKTYQSDLFNNWISTEWIDGDNGINAVTAVSTVDGNFTIDALNIAQKVYNMLNRIAISGGSYDDWLEAVYTHGRTGSVESPVYQGSLIKQLGFQEVISTGVGLRRDEQSPDTLNTTPLGDLAGRGQMTGKNKGGRIKIKVDEPSVIMALVSITPLIDYSQGNKWHNNLKTMDDLHKPSLDAIGYQDLVCDSMAWFSTTLDEDDEPQYTSAGKQPAWINYMTNVNQVRGDFAKPKNSMFMVLNRRFEHGDNGIADLTTYIDPSKFNHIFADTRLDAQNFWCQIGANITTRRKMSAKIIPNL